MHPPEPIYPCYLPVLGEFNRMTPHEGPSTSLPELRAGFESAIDGCGYGSTAGGCAARIYRQPFTGHVMKAGSS